MVHRSDISGSPIEKHQAIDEDISWKMSPEAPLMARFASIAKPFVEAAPNGVLKHLQIVAALAALQSEAPVFFAQDFPTGPLRVSNSLRRLMRLYRIVFKEERTKSVLRRQVAWPPPKYFIVVHSWLVINSLHFLFISCSGPARFL